MNQRIAAIVLLYALGGSAMAQSDLSDVQIKAVKVSEGIYMLTGAGGNIGVSVGPDGVFLIDDQYAPLTEKIKAAVAEFSSQPVRFVLNTHWHNDHTGGNENLGEAGTLIVAHDNVRLRMSTEQFLEAFGARYPPSPEVALPVVTFNDAVTFHLNDEQIHAFHVAPAHTDGDSLVHFRRANVVHMGDLFFNGLYPFIDVAAGGSIDGMIDALELALAMVNEDTRIIPGHGALGDRAALKEFHDMLVGVRAKIAPLVKSGKSLEQIIEAKPTRDYDEKWGKGFLAPDSFVKIVVAGMRAEKSEDR